MERAAGDRALARRDLESGHLIEQLHRLAELGVGVTLDDVGGDHATLANLTGAPLRGLKLDRSIIGQLPTQAKARALTDGTIALGRSLGLPVLAIGVETSAQLEHLRNAGCTHAQGFLFAKPMSADRVAQWLQRVRERSC